MYVICTLGGNRVEQPLGQGNYVATYKEGVHAHSPDTVSLAWGQRCIYHYGSRVNSDETAPTCIASNRQMRARERADAGHHHHTSSASPDRIC